MKITLKAARINAGLTRDQVAERLNVTPNTITRYESGKTSPTIPRAIALAEIYGLTIDDIDFSR